jgi:hypothetical protein
MTNSQRLEAIRGYLKGWFATQTDGQPWEASESILIREGFYCGRCFHLPGFRAVWFFEEDELKVYRLSGELLAVFHGQEIVAEAEAEPTLNLEAARAAAEAAQKQAADDGSDPVRRAA